MILFFQAEDGIRDAQESRGLGDVYKRQHYSFRYVLRVCRSNDEKTRPPDAFLQLAFNRSKSCLLYTSDAADDLLCVDLGGRRIIKKKKNKKKKKKRNTQLYSQSTPQSHQL